MKAPKTSLAIFMFFSIFVLCLCTTDKEITVSGSPLEVKPELDAIVAYINARDYTKNWHLFPGTDTSPASDTLRRLGLPVHGRWIRAYVNDIAFDFLKKAVNPDEVKAPLEFPPGSIIVKQNYRSNFDATSIDSRQSALGVLTIMFKPDPGFKYCATRHLEPYNGEDCLGGDWFYGFYTENPALGPTADSVKAHVNAFCINCHAPSYKTDYVRTLNAIRDPFALPSGNAYCDRFTTRTQATSNVNLVKKALTKQEKDDLQKGLDAYCKPSKLSPDLPSDVPFDPNKVFMAFGGKTTQDMFNCYAWKTFIALNWPNKLPKADGTPRRGEADKNKTFTGQRQQPAVWETFKPTFEVFQPNDVDWDPKDQQWNQVPPKLEGMKCEASEGEFILTMKSKTRDVANETGQAFAGSFGFLVDRNRKLVRYEVLFNRTEFEYLIDNGRAATKNLTPGGPKDEINKIKFPDTKTDPRKTGSIEVKSAWKELCFGDTCAYADAANLEAAKKKYYVRKVVIYDEDKQSCRNAYAGLIGLHIARKTFYAPQWIWMTFEHKDNVPKFGEETEANFYNPKNKAPDDCWQLPFLFPKLSVKFCPNVDLNRFVPELKDQPNQLTRLVPIAEEAAKANKQFTDQMKKEGGSPFENYVLVNAQWPLNGRNKDGKISPVNCSDNTLADTCFSMIPRYLRNTVVESYMSAYCSDKKTGKNIQFSNRSCMSCHGVAGADFSYIWLDAVSQRVGLKE